MRQRNIFAMILLSIVTLGIYSLYWSVSTKNEMNKLGANVPTAWLLIIPFVSIYWLWKYSEAVEQITGGKVSTPLAFVVEMLLSFIGDIIIQTEFNKLATAPAGGDQSYGASGYATSAPDGGPLPDNTFGGPVASTAAAAATPAPYAPTTPAAAAERPAGFTPTPTASSPDITPPPAFSPEPPTPSQQPQPPTQTPPQVQ